MTPSMETILAVSASASWSKDWMYCLRVRLFCAPSFDAVLGGVALVVDVEDAGSAGEDATELAKPPTPRRPPRPCCPWRRRC